MIKWTIEDLRRLEPFQACSTRELEEIVPYVFHRTYRKGQLLFTDGDPRERVYFLLAGYVRLERVNEAGTYQYVNYLKPSQLFPLSGMFTDTYYSHSAEALTDIEVVYIPTAYFESVITHHASMLRYVVRELSRVLRLHERRVQEIITPNATERVINTLHYLIEDLGEPEGDGVRIRCPFTTIELARLSGTSRETVSTTLSRLRKEDVLQFDSRQFIVDHPEFFDHWHDGE